MYCVDMLWNGIRFGSEGSHFKLSHFLKVHVFKVLDGTSARNSVDPDYNSYYLIDLSLATVSKQVLVRSNFYKNVLPFQVHFHASEAHF